MGRPLLLDLFSGAGGCAMGYYRAGFDVVGIDNRPQPRYPFRFIQGDALRPPVDLREFDAIHASPPCQRYSSIGFLNSGKVGSHETHPDLVDPIRDMLVDSGLPWVMENVPCSPLRRPVLLCGSMFGLLVRRHRLFETSFLLLTPECKHHLQNGEFPCGVSKKLRAGRKKATSSVVSVWGGVGGSKGSKALWCEAMGIDWMRRKELAQAIPPAYTEYIGKQLLRYIEGLAA
jgi:DNA (cytosine-5)-methyltransferase 1